MRYTRLSSGIGRMSVFLCLGPRRRQRHCTPWFVAESCASLRLVLTEIWSLWLCFESWMVNLIQLVCQALRRLEVVSDHYRAFEGHSCQVLNGACLRDRGPESACPWAPSRALEEAFLAPTSTEWLIAPPDPSAPRKFNQWSPRIQSLLWADQSNFWLDLLFHFNDLNDWFRFLFSSRVPLHGLGPISFPPWATWFFRETDQNYPSPAVDYLDDVIIASRALYPSPFHGCYFQPHLSSTITEPSASIRWTSTFSTGKPAHCSLALSFQSRILSPCSDLKQPDQFDFGSYKSHFTFHLIHFSNWLLSEDDRTFYSWQ